MLSNRRRREIDWHARYDCSADCARAEQITSQARSHSLRMRSLAQRSACYTYGSEGERCRTASLAKTDARKMTARFSSQLLILADPNSFEWLGPCLAETLGKRMKRNHVVKEPKPGRRDY